MVISDYQRYAIPATALLLGLITQCSDAQQRLSDPATVREVEAEMFDEINRLRADPATYAIEVLEPLKATLRRIPADLDEAYEASRVFLSDDPIDYIDIPEGESTEGGLAVIDEAIEALKATPKLAKLKRNEPLNRAARWFSDDFQREGEQRPPHVDSLGRLPAARISTFGATARALAQWERFSTQLDQQGRTTIYSFQKEEISFLVDLPARGGYRYRSVDESFGKFVVEHGTEVTIPRLDEEGFTVEVQVDTDNRLLRVGEASISYPLQMPMHGENVVWGPWSRQLAARGLVCWWIIDPGIADRGHRQMLLEPSLRFCGVGCTWSRGKGFVATFDATTEELQPVDNGSARNE
ncbi:MAG: hypothetical protein H6822_23375 [Planctomycetaceae bacterium]|nr:hypothetical protein [Planctomycetales bacterium]MCB9925140.1 hypothetical protein [Planctomycetaceae bacterium]